MAMKPKTLKIVLVLIGIAYVLFPRDLVPDRLGRGFGYIDDILVVLLLSYIYRRAKKRQAGGGAQPGARPPVSGTPPGQRQSPGQSPGQRQRPGAAPRPRRARRTSARPGDTASSSPPRSSAVRTPHEVLGVSPSATQDEIRAAYRARMTEYHPDRVSHLGEELRKLAHEKTLAIQRAYEALKR